MLTYEIKIQTIRTEPHIYTILYVHLGTNILAHIRVNVIFILFPILPKSFYIFASPCMLIWINTDATTKAANEFLKQ